MAEWAWLKDALPVAKRILEASNKNLDLFFVALKSPRRVLARWKRDSMETVRRAFVFSLVPVSIAFLIELPYWAFYVPNVLTWWGIAGILSLYYVQMVIGSLMLLIVGWLFRGKATMKDCFAANLVFMANLWPANELIAWLMKPYKVLLCARVTGTWVASSWEKVAPSDLHYYFWISLPLLIYYLIIIPPAIRHVERVGWARAIIIYLLYHYGSLFLGDLALKPLFAKIYAPVCT